MCLFAVHVPQHYRPKKDWVGSIKTPSYRSSTKCISSLQATWNLLEVGADWRAKIAMGRRLLPLDGVHSSLLELTLSFSTENIHGSNATDKFV
ncbi:blast:Protein kish [Drosophila guanche]|uniref:Blast:Protein kish n=1 Tax=Drosophila guanche TaxID=7266 RepID=A0A3B0KTC9_DROGU|nr:blast:Protein kish [Drosophila guanche]